MGANPQDRKIGVDVVINAIAFPFQNIFQLLQLSLIPTLLAGALIYIIYKVFIAFDFFTDPAEDFSRLQQSLTLFTYLVNVVLLVLGIIVATGIHRLIIRGEKPGWVIFRFRRYELAYTGVWILALILMILVVGLVLFGIRFGFHWMMGGSFSAWAPQDFPAVDFVFLLIWFSVMTVLMIRLSLIFPHAAVTGRISLSTSWNATRGNFWRFVGLAIVLGIIISIVALLILTFFLSGPGVPGAPGRNILDGLLTMIGSVFGIIWMLVNSLIFFIIVAFISFIYRDLVKTPAQENG